MGHIERPNLAVGEEAEEAVVGEEGPSVAELIVAVSMQPSCEDLHGEKETLEVTQSSTRAHEARRNCSLELLGGAEQGKASGEASAAARSGKWGSKLGFPP